VESPADGFENPACVEANARAVRDLEEAEQKGAGLLPEALLTVEDDLEVLQSAQLEVQRDFSERQGGLAGQLLTRPVSPKQLACLLRASAVVYERGLVEEDSHAARAAFERDKCDKLLAKLLQVEVLRGEVLHSPIDVLSSAN